MPRKRTTHPTDAELEILGVLWGQGEGATLGEVYDGVRQRRPVARTTVATMLGVMLEKGLVRRAEREGGYVWSAAVSRGAAARGMVAKVIDSIFDGSARRMVAHLVEEGQLSEGELDEVRKLLKGRPGKRKDGGAS